MYDDRRNFLVKKILCFALSAIMMLSMSMTAFADDATISEGSSAPSTVTYSVDSQYMVIIPETIDATVGGDITFRASLMNLLDGQQVNVYCPTLANGQYLNLYNSKGESITMTFNGMRGDACVASFQNGATTSDFTVSPYVSADMAKAGDYSGTLEFTVSIQPLDTY